MMIYGLNYVSVIFSLALIESLFKKITKSSDIFYIIASKN